MQEYAALGIDTFAEGIFPLLTAASNDNFISNAPGNPADRERDLLMLPRTGSGSENLTEMVK